MQAAEITEKAKKFNATFKLRYDALRALCEAYGRTQLMKSENHKCLFALICTAIPDRNWNFFEHVRTTRNNIQYRGKAIAQQEVKNTKLQFTLTYKAIQEHINQELAD